MGAGGVAMIDLFVFQRLCIRFGEWWFVMEVLDSSCFGWRFWRIGAGGFAMIDLFFPNGFALENTITLTSIFPRVFPHVVFLSLFFSFRKKSIDSRPGKGETPKNITRSLIIITLGGWVVDPQSMPFVSMLV